MSHDSPSKIALIDALNDDLRHKSNDLWRYAIDSSPHVPRGDEFFLEVYARLTPIDDDNAHSLRAAIEILGGVASPGVWDLGLADMNYLNVRHLNRLLTRLVGETLDQLESHLPLAKGYPRIEGILQTVIADTRHQKEQLENLQDAKNETKLPALKAAATESDSEEKAAASTD